MAESEKYISYSAAKWHLYHEFITDKEAAKRAFRALSAIPAAEVRPVVRGKWKRVVDFTGVEAFGFKETMVVGWGL